jgi:hypothetical protein
MLPVVENLINAGADNASRDAGANPANLIADRGRQSARAGMIPGNCTEKPGGISGSVGVMLSEVLMGIQVRCCRLFTFSNPGSR